MIEERYHPKQADDYLYDEEQKHARILKELGMTDKTTCQDCLLCSKDIEWKPSLIEEKDIKVRKASCWLSEDLIDPTLHPYDDCGCESFRSE